MSTFQLDKAHSDVTFQVKHMMVSKAKGEFKNFDIQVTGDIENLESLQVTAEIDAASIDTNNTDRDNHLRSADFFDVEHHPKITIKSQSVKKVSDTEYELTAQVTIRGVTKTETFRVHYNGLAKHPMTGKMVAGFEVSGKINRDDYGLTWNAPLETGGLLVGKEVTINANLEFVVE